jgi:glycosidase
MTTVIISDVLKKDEGGTVDFKEVDESYGTTTDFAGAVKKLKSEGLRVLLQLTPNHFGLKHQWFADKPDFYIQKPADEVDGSNWKTADGAASAWATDTNNNSVKYLSQFSGNVDLDYRNDNVITEMKVHIWRAQVN